MPKLTERERDQFLAEPGVILRPWRPCARTAAPP